MFQGIEEESTKSEKKMSISMDKTINFSIGFLFGTLDNTLLYPKERNDTHYSRI